jgi:succinate dehydrogenase/fumarate reductase flavoprotein subunit
MTFTSLGIGESTADVLVVGAGLAGMCAAAAATQHGARVIVVERAPAIGGSAALSHGNLWTVVDEQILRGEDPGHFQRHGHVIVEDFADTVSWLESYGGALEPLARGRRRQAQRFDLPTTLLGITRAVEGRGGRVRCGASITEVDHVADGVAVTIEHPDGRMSLTAGALVVATGGRQADPAVRRDLTGGVPSLLRGNPYSDGGGARLAEALGAALNRENRGFYGHLLPVGVTPLSGLDYLMLSLYHSTTGLLFGRSGHRFTDERRGDASNSIALAANGGDGVLLWSEAEQQRAAVDPAPVDFAVDRWAYAGDRGGRVGRAENAAALAELLASWEWPTSDAIVAGDNLAPLGNGPVYAAHVRPAITFTYGGVCATDDGAALGSDGAAVPRLFTAGADMSDLYHEGYCGGLSAAAVTGRRAGTAAGEASVDSAAAG